LIFGSIGVERESQPAPSQQQQQQFLGSGYLMVDSDVSIAVDLIIDGFF
jgi:hypothetical protein